MNVDAQNTVLGARCDQNMSHASESASVGEMTDDEKFDVVAARVLEKYKPAFLELANEQEAERQCTAHR